MRSFQACCMCKCSLLACSTEHASAPQAPLYPPQPLNLVYEILVIHPAAMPRPGKCPFTPPFLMAAGRWASRADFTTPGPSFWLSTPAPAFCIALATPRPSLRVPIHVGASRPGRGFMHYHLNLCITTLTSPFRPIPSFKLLTPVPTSRIAVPTLRPSFQVLFPRRLHRSDEQFSVRRWLRYFRITPFSSFSFRCAPATLLSQRLGRVFGCSSRVYFIARMSTSVSGAGFTTRVPLSGTAFEWLGCYSCAGFTSRMRSLGVCAGFTSGALVSGGGMWGYKYVRCRRVAFSFLHSTVGFSLSLSSPICMSRSLYYLLVVIYPLYGVVRTNFVSRQPHFVSHICTLRDRFSCWL